MDVDLITLCDRWHPKYGSYCITDFIPSPADVFANIADLQEHGDPDGKLSQLQGLLVKMARLICRDTAITFALVADRLDMPDDVRLLVDLCLPPAEPSEEAFAVWLRIVLQGAEMERQTLQSSSLASDVKSAVLDLVQRRVIVLQQQAGSAEELAMQVVAAWWMQEETWRTAGVALDAVGLAMGDQQATEQAQRLHPLDTDYILALTEVRGVPLKQFACVLKQTLNRHERIRHNPSGTGKNPEYEHEVAESQLDLPEDAPSPLELAPSSEPDPAQVVVESSPILLAFQQLKPEEQQIVLLHAQGFTDAEVAQMLNLPVETAKKRRQRAVKKLEQALSA